MFGSMEADRRIVEFGLGVKLSMILQAMSEMLTQIVLSLGTKLDLLELRTSSLTTALLLISWQTKQMRACNRLTAPLSSLKIKGCTDDDKVMDPRFPVRE